MNLTNISVTPLHIAFDEVCKKAEARGIRVTGSELVGLVPLKSMLDAGKYFLKKQKRSTGISEKEIIRIAVLSMGLDELSPFKPEERIIEYLLDNPADHNLVNLTLADFADETASESPAPGGGSVAAYLGVLGVSLGTMVANLSAHKKGWDDRWELFSDCADQGSDLIKELLLLVDEDTKAFEGIMKARSLPKSTEQEKSHRQKTIREATRYAIDIPYKVMLAAFKSMELLLAMARMGNANSASDTGVGAICARSAVAGAYLNIRINASGVDSDQDIEKILAEGKKIQEAANVKEKEILELINKVMAGNI
jgi:glutamate formiminotransferase / formiminotetrahydrofolate cyclodeaminase